MQILLDDERYRRLEREAQESGRSVAALVREAIDLRFESGHAKRAEAARRVIAEFSDETFTEPDWRETKQAFDRELDRKLP